jgi:hypothetical protein
LTIATAELSVINGVILRIFFVDPRFELKMISFLPCQHYTNVSVFDLRGQKAESIRELTLNNCLFVGYRDKEMAHAVENPAVDVFNLYPT